MFSELFPPASGNEVWLPRSDAKPGSGGFSPERRTETAITTVHRTTATSSQPEVHNPVSAKLDQPAALEDKTLSLICILTAARAICPTCGSTSGRH